MTQATSLTARWYERPRTIEAQPREHGPLIWEVEGVRISLGGGDTLKIESKYHGSYPHQREMRVEVTDAEVRFPLEDLVPFVLDRLDINEVAQMICGDTDARRSLLEALASRYNEHGIEDEDRRHWIAKVQSAIHDKRLDELTTALVSLERSVGQIGYRAMSQIDYGNVIRHEMKAAGVDQDIAEAAANRYKCPAYLVDFSRFINVIDFGPTSAWHQARDFWRNQVKALFQNVEVPSPEPEETPF